jgi:transglutaminase-like putative cysteine protease
MKLVCMILFFFLVTEPLVAENYLLNGGQKSTINYKLRQNIEPTHETVTVNISFVIPQNFASPTFNQEINNLKISFSKNPDDTKEWTDEHNNRIAQYTWNQPKTAFHAEIAFSASNWIELHSITINDPFPVVNVPQSLHMYLESTEQAPSNNAKIRQKSSELVRSAKTQFDAVQKILTWIIDHMYYVLTPEAYDALYSFNSGKGNCQNYSHLAAALMRASGIPVRIVNGITLKEPYDIKIGNQILTLNMAQGRHSWIEVYFPSLGWMPFDPQQTELFVSNRFIRAEVGLDNNDTAEDGLVRWTRKKGSKEILAFEEFIESDFLQDAITLNGKKLAYGPRKLLLQPDIKADFHPVVKAKREEPAPAPVKEKPFSEYHFTKPYTMGNIEFPEGVNFAFSREISTAGGGETQELTKNFLVETAEYVTSKQQYCQVFILDKVLFLQNIALALQRFGGSGEVWLELREEVDGLPGDVAARSQPVNLKHIKAYQGYFWVDFNFSDQGLILTPDRYWISLAYRGSPILNWFYSYGKPVGPIDGTRYKLLTETAWNKTVGYEFNYRVAGLVE